MLTTIDRAPSKVVTALTAAGSMFGVQPEVLATENYSQYFLTKPLLKIPQEYAQCVEGDWKEFQQAVSHLIDPYISFKHLHPIKQRAARNALYKAALMHDKVSDSVILLPYYLEYKIGQSFTQEMQGDTEDALLIATAWIPPHIHELGKEGVFGLALQPPQGKKRLYKIGYTADTLYE